MPLLALQEVQKYHARASCVLLPVAACSYVGFAPPKLVVDDDESNAISAASSFTPSTWLASSNAPPGFAFSTVPATDDDYLVLYVCMYLYELHVLNTYFGGLFELKPSYLLCTLKTNLAAPTRVSFTC